MSWVRWGMDGSQVYVYDGGPKETSVTCCACTLNRADFYADSDAEMLDHLRQHVAAGHVVPEWLFAEPGVGPDADAAILAACGGQSVDGKPLQTADMGELLKRAFPPERIRALVGFEAIPRTRGRE